MQATLFLSNRQEKLFEQVKKELFAKKDSPFARRLLVVPSRAVKNWLFSQLASDLPIASGIETLSLTHLFKLLSSDLPTSLDLSFQIEEELEKIEKDEKDNPLFAPLLPALVSFESKAELAALLGKKFSELGTYALAHHREWQREPKVWQEALWQRLFSKKNPYEELFLSKKTQKIKGALHSIHLFGFPTFSPAEFSLFERVSIDLPLFYYFLSPSLEFFGDNLSVDEVEAILEKQTATGKNRLELEESFSGQNPLLGELGRVKRLFINEAVERNLPSIEAYEEVEEKSTLSHLQADLLYNKRKEWEGIDDSISIDSYSSRFDEMEGLFTRLAKLISEKGVEPKDIIVMTPDIASYLPYIPAFFGKKIDYRVSDLPLASSSPLFEGLMRLFSLEKERWQEEALLDLLSLPSFQKRQGLDEAMVFQIKKWIKRAAIHFSYNEEHLDKLLPASACRKSTHTWVEGLNRLFSELASSDSIELSNAPLLGQFTSLLDSLYSALKPLHDKSQRSMAGWSDYLLFLAESFFDEEVEELMHFLKPLKREKILPFSSFLFYFEKSLSGEKRAFRGSHLQAVTFSSLFAMRTLPAKVVALIGMNEEAFPRKEESSLVEGMRLDKMDSLPLAPDHDRSLFLEALLSVRESLLISYLGRDPIENRELLPSPLVSLLRSYIGDPPIVSQGSMRCASIITSSRIEKSSPQTNCVKPLYIDLKELTLLVRSPLRLFFKKSKGFDFGFDPATKEEEEFLLPAWKMASLRRSLLQDSVERVMTRAQKKGELPDHQFIDVAKRRIEEEAKKIEEKVIRFSPKSGKLFTLEFSPLVSSFQEEEEGHFLLPCHSIKVQGKEIFLSGTISGISEKALFIADKCSLVNTIKYLPAFLLLNASQSPFSGLPLLFVKEGKLLERQLDEKEHLMRLLDYYFFAIQNPSFLFPAFVEPFLLGENEKLEKVIRETLNQKQDQALLFAERVKMRPKTGDLMARFSPLAKTLYQEVADGWF